MEINELSPYIKDYLFSFAFFGSFLFGSAYNIALSMLVYSLGSSIHLVTLGCILGNICSDLLWFYMAKHRIKLKIIDKIKEKTQSESKLKNLLGRFKKHEIYFFVVVKFVYGIRILSILFLGSHQYPWKRFLPYNSLAVIILNGCLCYSAWYYAQGLSEAFYFLEGMGQVFLILLIGLILFFLIRTLISKLILKN